MQGTCMLIISRKPYFNAIGFVSVDAAYYSLLSTSLLTCGSKRTKLSGSDFAMFPFSSRLLHYELLPDHWGLSLPLCLATL